MSGDTVRTPHIANKIFPMATSEIGRHIQSCHNQYYISAGHRLCHIWSSDQAEQMWKQLFLIQNRLAVTANQTWWQSRQKATKPVLSISLTYHSQTWYVDSWHHSGDIQTIWWPLTSGGRQTTMTLFTIPPTYNINCNSDWFRCFVKRLKNWCLLTLCLC